MVCDGEVLIGSTEIAVPWRKPYARLAAMAVNDSDAFLVRGCKGENHSMSGGTGELMAEPA